MVKLQALQAGDKDPHIQELYAQHNKLLEAHNALVTGTNNNFSIYNRSIQELDSRIGAVFSVVQDIVDSIEDATKASSDDYLVRLTRTTVKVGDVESVRVDWMHYINNHIALVKAEIAKLQEAQRAIEAKLVAETEPLITPQASEETAPEGDEDEPVEFGGDHAKAQQQSAST